MKLLRKAFLHAPPTFDGPHRGSSPRPLLIGGEVAARIRIGGDEEAARVIQEAQAGVLHLHRGGQT